MPLWRAQAYLQEMSCALLSTEYERAYQNGNAMVRPQDAYLPSDSSYPTSHPRDNSAKKGLLNVVNAVIFTTTPKSNYRVCPRHSPKAIIVYVHGISLKQFRYVIKHDLSKNRFDYIKIAEIG